MLYDMIELNYESANAPLNAFEDAIHERNLIFTARSLGKFGFHSMDEISQAVQRAIMICSGNGLSVQEHFKPIYISDQDSHTIEKDWKLSRLAYTLVIINGASDNPTVAHLQLEILQKYIGDKDKN